MKRPLNLFFLILSLAGLAIFSILTLSFGNRLGWLSSRSFWTIWLMTVLPIVFSTAITVVFLCRFSSMRTYTVAPLLICSSAFEVVSYALSIRLLFTIASFLDRIMWFMWTFESIFLIIYAVILFYFIYGTSHIGKQHRETQKKVRYIREYAGQLDLVLPTIQDEKLKNAVTALRDDIRYSDPMSSREVAGLEAALASTVTEIVMRIRQDGDYDGCALQIEKARALVAERNLQIRLSK